MARAKRYYIPGHVWHITHRCHKREFLLKFAKDRQCWLQWLLKARKRYGLVILNYMVTSNDIHLLVVDDGDRDVIPRSIQVAAGRAGQAYNIRKSRKGAFWEDRHHATAIESGEHLLRCIVYIDLNMVRANVANHPSEWAFSGYNEIQNPRRKCALIAYERLRALLNFSTYDRLVVGHRQWVDQSLAEPGSGRDSKWTQSIAVGGEEFAARTKHLLGVRAKGRTVLSSGDTYQVREPGAGYRADFDSKTSSIEVENAYAWDDKFKI
jgi:putative transposase